MNKACQACASLHLPRRPSLTAHRGCSLDYPENSEVAFQRAVSIPSVTTLETDVQVSSDGELFLLHDPHLARTTAVATSCPSVNPLHIASQLGYHTGTCTLSSLPLLQDCSQHVPLFKHFLRTAATAGVNIVFDLYRPPAGHAHEKDYVNLTLETILQSGMVLSKVWFLTRACQTSSECIVLKALEGGRGGGEEPVISAGFPALTRVSKTSQTKLDQFVALGITIANEEWSTSLDTLR